MLTPSFSLVQTDAEVTLTVRAPLANITQTELSIVEDVLIFYSSPYYLRLHLPGKVIEVEGDTGKYNADTQEFCFSLKKVVPGECFPDLDLIGKLLVPSKKIDVKPDIQISSEEVIPSSDPESDDDLGYIDQKIILDRPSDVPRYGFANKVPIGKDLRLEFREILDFVAFDNTTYEDLALLREADEQAKFSEDHYLADLMDPNEINELLAWAPALPISADEVKFTFEEKERIKNLGNRDYLLEPREKKIVLLSLVDIIFAYAFDKRTTCGEETVESAWTINKLSPTLSWFQSFNSIEEVKIASGRRAVIFPLHRHWQLVLAVFDDTLKILKLGRRQILKCLLHIHEMFANSEPRYLLNQLYITDYCIWLQKVSEDKIRRLAAAFEEVSVTKDDLRLDLEELEDAALLVLRDEEELNITNRLMDIKIARDIENREFPSDTDSSEYSSDSSSSSSSDDDSSLDSDDISSSED